MRGVYNKKDIQDRFWEKVKKTNYCWEWKASKRKDGYGRFRFNNDKMIVAHRVSLMISNKPIPTGMWVDHICKNRGCVKPSHLRIVTPRQNALENSNSPVANNASKKYCKRGHILEGDNLLKHRLPTRACKICLKINKERDN